MSMYMLEKTDTIYHEVAQTRSVTLSWPTLFYADFNLIMLFVSCLHDIWKIRIESFNKHVNVLTEKDYS